MLRDDQGGNAQYKATGLNAVTLAVAALLASSSAPAQSSLKDLIERAKQVSNHPASHATPPLLIRPSSNAIQLDHSSHASHTSHNSHYSSSTDNGGGADSPDNGTPAPSPAAPSPPPPPPPPPVGAPGEPSDTHYPYTVYLVDHRIIKCDIQDDGDFYNLIKKGGTIRVAKSDVEKIERTGDPSSTQPSTSTKPTTQPTP